MIVTRLYHKIMPTDDPANEVQASINNIIEDLNFTTNHHAGLFQCEF